MLDRIYQMKAFMALGAVNFRIFILGQSVSLVGTWMQRLAMSWLVLRLTGSAAGLGLVELSNQAPILVTGFFAGSILDRYDMKKILITTQSLCMIQALSLAFLDFTGIIRYSQVLLLSFFLGLVTSIDLPARQSCVVRMLDRHAQLNSALTINSAVFNLARLVGPAFAGFALQAVGETMCFFLNAVSYLAVIFSLTRLKIKKIELPVRQSGWKSFREGLDYTIGFTALKKILMASTLFFFLCFPFTTLLPFFAKNIFHSDASILGLFLGSVGLGAIIGVIYQASLVPVNKLHIRVTYSVGMFGLGLAAFSISRSVELSCAALTVLGFGMSTGSVCFNTLVQSIIDEEKRGRVMSLYTVGNVGIGPIGSLTAGMLADLLGGTFSGLIFGLGAVFLAVCMKRTLKSVEPTIIMKLSEKGLADVV
ncbi:MAG: MFS transporter [Synergistaceae bacterium]|nr:MFS transporter [Synergistaceae bacterium]